VGSAVVIGAWPTSIGDYASQTLSKVGVTPPSIPGLTTPSTTTP
jgi:hypothetical protein